MAPSAKELESALIDATCEVFKADPDATSVNKVRKQAEDNLELDDGFFSNGEWKQKSKALIKQYVGKLLEGWSPEIKEETSETKDNVKRASSEPDSPVAKRQKRASSSKKSIKDESDLSDEEDKEKAKAKASSPRKRKRESKDESEEETKIKSKSSGSDRKALKSESEDEAESKPAPAKVKKRRSSDEDEKPSVQDDEEKPAVEEDKDEKPAVDEEDEYSDVIDEGPAPKRKGKGKVMKENEVKKEKDASKKAAKAAPKKASSPDDPDEAEIKKLQGYLVKCGVRKLWHNELKKYGNDSRAKIKHLKKMLKDVGMDGRFSEAKAREIKETRELLAEAEAAQEMNALWGTGGGDRASRSKTKGKTMKEEASDGSDNEEKPAAGVKDEDDDEDDEQSFAARRRRAHADLAFLGDESDSS